MNGDNMFEWFNSIKLRIQLEQLKFHIKKIEERVKENKGIHLPNDEGIFMPISFAFPDGKINEDSLNGFLGQFSLIATDLLVTGSCRHTEDAISYAMESMYTRAIAYNRMVDISEYKANYVI